MNQNNLWGILLVVFVVWNGVGLMYNLYEFTQGTSHDIDIIIVSLQILVVGILSYIIWKVYIPLWTKKDYKARYQ